MAYGWSEKLPPYCCFHLAQCFGYDSVPRPVISNITISNNNFDFLSISRLNICVSTALLILLMDLYSPAIHSISFVSLLTFTGWPIKMKRDALPGLESEQT